MQTQATTPQPPKSKATQKAYSQMGNGTVRSSFQFLAICLSLINTGNCTPRLPAINFQVKKEGRNKNRWFYTCQTNKEDGGCGFFLWGEEAQVREGKAVIGNSRSEVVGNGDGREVRNGDRRTPGKGFGSVEERERGRVRRYGGVDIGSGGGSGSKGRASDEAAKESGTLRNTSSDGSGSTDTFGEWLSPSDERRVLQETEIRYSSPPWPSTQDEEPSTPSRKAQKTTEVSTPSSKRKKSYVDHESAEGLPTPVTGGGRIRNASEYGFNDSDPFSTPSSLRTGSGSLFGIRSPSHTPQPSHMRQPDYPELPQPSHILDHENTTAASNPYDLTPEVLALLQEEGISLDANIEQKLKSLLGKHAMRVSGIAKGRDITRVALKAKDVKIAEFGVRIGQLETEREVDRRVLKGLRAEREGSGRR